MALRTASDGRIYRSISEVSEMIGVKAHVLRYWETQFSMLRPRKNRAGNRMYRADEVKMLMKIKDLLYARRFTIEGARRHLLDERKDGVPQVEIAFTEADSRIVLSEIKDGLRQILTKLRTN